MHTYTFHRLQLIVSVTLLYQSHLKPASRDSITLFDMSQQYLSIYEAAASCQERLRQCLKPLDFPALENDDWARKRLADFNLWASGSRALSKQRTLDERLATQPQAKKVVIDLLCLLEVFVQQCQSTGK